MPSEKRNTNNRKKLSSGPNRSQFLNKKGVGYKKINGGLLFPSVRSNS
jgi:hypothetical protein